MFKIQFLVDCETVALNIICQETCSDLLKAKAHLKLCETNTKIIT